MATLYLVHLIQYRVADIKRAVYVVGPRARQMLNLTNISQYWEFDEIPLNLNSSFFFKLEVTYSFKVLMEN